MKIAQHGSDESWCFVTRKIEELSEYMREKEFHSKRRLSHPLTVLDNAKVQKRGREVRQVTRKSVKMYCRHPRCREPVAAERLREFWRSFAVDAPVIPDHVFVSLGLDHSWCCLLSSASLALTTVKRRNVGFYKAHKLSHQNECAERSHPLHGRL